MKKNKELMRKMVWLTAILVGAIHFLMAQPSVSKHVPLISWLLKN